MVSRLLEALLHGEESHVLRLEQAEQHFLAVIASHLHKIIRSDGVPYYLYENRPDKPFGEILYGILTEDKINIFYSYSIGNTVRRVGLPDSYEDINESNYRIKINLGERFAVEEVGAEENLKFLHSSPHPSALGNSKEGMKKKIAALNKVSAVLDNR